MIWSIYRSIFILLILINSNSVSAEENHLKIRGYVKPLLTLTDFESLDASITGKDSITKPEKEVSLVNTFRVNLFWQPGDDIMTEFAYELVPRLRDPNVLSSFFTVQAADPLSYRLFDMGQKISLFSDSSNLQLFQNLDRAYITFSPEFGDIHIGRQPIAFGSARVINPTDILTSFSYVELNQEERIGVDAVRLKVPAGTLSEIDMGAVFGDDFSSNDSAAFLRGRFILLESDLSPLLILFKQNLLLGLDIASSIGDAGYWFESAFVFANIMDDHITNEDYLRISSGLDYSFTEDLYAYIEYHFNGAGQNAPEDYPNLILGIENNIAYREGAVYLFGKHYAAPGFSYQATPLLTFFAQALYNMRDNSVLLFPDFQYSLANNATLEAGAFIGAGKKSRIIKNADTGIISISSKSEFSLYPDTYFVSVRYYF